MPRPLTLKQLWVLQRIRACPGETMDEISKASPIDAAKSADYAERFGKPKFRDAWEIPSIEYTAVQQAMKRLLDLGLVRREVGRGGSGKAYAHFPVETDQPEDELERAFAADAGKGRKK